MDLMKLDIQKFATPEIDSVRKTYFNNTELTNIYYNDTELDKMYYNNVLVFEKGPTLYKRRIMVGDNLKGKTIYSDIAEGYYLTLNEHYSGQNNYTIFIESQERLAQPFSDNANPGVPIYDVQGISTIFYSYYQGEETIQSTGVVDDVDYTVSEIVDDNPSYRHLYIEDPNIRPIQIGDTLTSGTILYFVFPDNFYEKFYSIPPNGLYTNIVTLEGNIFIMNYCNSPDDIGMMIADSGKGGVIYLHEQDGFVNMSKYVCSGTATVEGFYHNQFGQADYILVDTTTLG